MGDMFGAIPTPKPGHWIGAIWVTDADPAGATDAEVASAVAVESAARAAADATKESVAQVGLLANRPSAVGNNKTFYWATDDNGGTMYMSDGANWLLVAPRGTELMALERTATNVSIVNTASQADVTGLNGTVVSRGRPLRVTFGCGLIQCTAAANGLSAQLMEDVGDTGTFTQVGVLVRSVAAANGFSSGGAAVRERPAQTAGTVIRYKLQVANLVAGTATTTIFCNANGSQPYVYVHEA